MEKSPLLDHFKLHFVVLIYGFTAILGKLIALPATQLVWYRMLIAAVSFFLFLRFRKVSFRISMKEFLQLSGIGLVVAAHWITFFAAIKISNVSVTLGCLASSTLFTSFLEPLLSRKRVNPVEVFIGLIIIAGLYLIFRFETRYFAGIIVALVSAFLAGLFTVLNKKMVARHAASVISFYEMVSGFLGITIFLLLSGEFSRGIQLPSSSDIFYLLLLGVICTGYAFAIQVDVMNALSAYVVSLSINLEPVYGIILAFFFFGDSELMTGGFYIGTSIILSAVIGYPIFNRLSRG